MRVWAFRQVLRAAIGALAGVLILASSAMAQNDSRPTTAQFLANPGQVLRQHPNGGAKCISLVRDLALGDPTTLQPIIALLSYANLDQQMCIGSGLGQAAQASIRSNPAYANQIQQDLASSGFQNAIIAFAGVTGNVQTAATGGGGGGGGGGVGGPTSSAGLAFGGTNSGSSQTFGDSHFQTSSQNLFTGGGAGAGGASNSSGSNRSVSPH